jgi:adenylate kinase family enzyme
LADIPEDSDQELSALGLARGMANVFGPAALKIEQWQSEGDSGAIYSRVRTLPAILSLCSPENLTPHMERVHALVENVWASVRSAPKVSGVREYDLKDPLNEEGYPPNTFHTYWAFRTVVAYRQTFGKPPPVSQERLAAAAVWSERVLGTQIALGAEDSESFDGQQLGWALATRLLLTDTGWIDPWTRETRDLFSAGLQAFFSAQTERGTWPRYRPLFHYKLTGNAYCYPFETLAHLLRFATRSANRRVAESFLPHFSNLKRAWKYAQDSAQGVGAEHPHVDAWCSHHHPHRTEPESWATASVLSFLQSFRRLVGHWTAERAAAQLGARAPSENETTLFARGRTWTPSPAHLSAGDQVAGLFLHPIAASQTVEETVNPDVPRIAKNGARGAILFGPPGTSKTTLAESLAGALGWRFVEIQASHFLSEGMDKIPSQADRIFTQVMELDRCVVLFDEIDELVRERAAKDKEDSKDEPTTDPFGRFLTTLMLPKLAALWKQRRVVYFVATNLVGNFDDAIKRSQRFDATIFVAPPSFDVKVEELTKLKAADVLKNLSNEKIEAELSSREGLGTLALLRFDQIEALVATLRSAKSGEDSLKDCLTKLVPDFKVEIDAFQKQRGQERRDVRAAQVGRLSAAVASAPTGTTFYATSNGPGRYVKFDLSVDPPLEMTGQGWKAKRGLGLTYEVEPES